MKEFNRDESVIMRKADKNNVYVLLNRDYTNVINDILSDEMKFVKTNSDPTENLTKIT